MGGEGLGEGGAAFDAVGHLDEGVLEGGVALLALEDADGAHQGEAGVDQGGKLTGEGHEGGGLDAALEPFGHLELHVEAGGLLLGLGGASPGEGLDLGGEELALLDLGEGLGLVRGLDLSGDFLAFRIECGEFEACHGVLLRFG